jgi:hypothetical protein
MYYRVLSQVQVIHNVLCIHGWVRNIVQPILVTLETVQFGVEVIPVATKI